MTIEKVSTEAAPVAIGPYSQAVVAGDFIFFSGQIPLTPEGKVVSGTIEAQTRQVLSNMAAVLGAAGLGYDDIVKTTIYLTDLGDFAKVNELYGGCFTGTPPARACVEVSALPKGVSIEIDWIAYRGK